MLGTQRLGSVATARLDDQVSVTLLPQRRCSRVLRRTVVSVMAASKVGQGVAGRTWEQMWTDGVPPGTKFDIGNVSVPLAKLLERKTVAVEGRRTFVPGCGRGYDVVAFAKAGAAVSIGLELSGTAVCFRHTVP